jgi:Putative copper export protein
MIHILALWAPPGIGGGESLAWNEVVGEYLQFAGYFLSIGAVGYRLLVLPRMSRANRGAPPWGSAAAANLGMIGALLLLISALGSVEMNAILHDKSFTASLPKAVGRFEFKLAAIVFSFAGFAIARSLSAAVGWTVAAIAILATVLQPLSTGRLGGSVNAVHVLAASTWIGTLTVMLFAGLRALTRDSEPTASRQEVAAGIVNAFSPVALVAATVLALSGVTTAWLHLKHVPALWETNYGRALVVKLCLVAGVVSLGWWNWKRMKPVLNAEGKDESVTMIQRSATSEVLMGALVLIATAVLVSLPSPK